MVARIPRMVHIIWMQGETAMPANYKAFLLKWRQLHPGWRIQVWSEDAIRDAVRQYFGGEAAGVFSAEVIPKMVERTDLGRIFLLTALGGIYADADYEPLRSFEPLLANLESVASQKGWDDIAAYPRYPGFGANNALLVASEGSTFMRDVLLPRMTASVTNTLPFRDRLMTLVLPTWPTLCKTGPVALSRAAGADKAAHVLSMSLQSLLGERLSDAPEEIVYGIHHHHGSWIDKGAVKSHVFGSIAVAVVICLLVINGAVSMMHKQRRQRTGGGLMGGSFGAFDPDSGMIEGGMYADGMYGTQHHHGSAVEITRGGIAVLAASALVAIAAVIVEWREMEKMTNAAHALSETACDDGQTNCTLAASTRQLAQKGKLVRTVTWRMEIISAMVITLALMGAGVLRKINGRSALLTVLLVSMVTGSIMGFRNYHIEGEIADATSAAMSGVLSKSNCDSCTMPAVT